MSSIQPSAALPNSTLWSHAIALLQKLIQRLVVPVASTEEMSDVWTLYRLTRSSDSVQPAVIRKLASAQA